MLAALAPRFGGSADGADRSQKIARVNPLAHPLRAREDGAIRACDGPTGAAPILFHLFAGGGADRPARIELDQVDRPLPSYGGLLRQHPLRRSTETGLLAALAPRFGGSADGADRSQKIARVNPLDHPLRAREDGAIRACDGPTGAAPILFTYSLAVELIDLHASSSTRSTGRCRAMGSPSTTPPSPQH